MPGLTGHLTGNRYFLVPSLDVCTSTGCVWPTSYRSASASLPCLDRLVICSMLCTRF